MKQIICVADDIWILTVSLKKLVNKQCGEQGLPAWFLEKINTDPLFIMKVNSRASIYDDVYVSSTEMIIIIFHSLKVPTIFLIKQKKR